MFPFILAFLSLHVDSGVLYWRIDRLTMTQGEVVARIVFHAIPREPGELLIFKAKRLLLS